MLKFCPNPCSSHQGNRPYQSRKASPPLLGFNDEVVTHLQVGDCCQLLGSCFTRLSVGNVCSGPLNRQLLDSNKTGRLGIADLTGALQLLDIQARVAATTCLICLLKLSCQIPAKLLRHNCPCSMLSFMSLRSLYGFERTLHFADAC